MDDFTPLHCIEYTPAHMDPDYRKFRRVFSTGYFRPSRHSNYGRAKYQDQITVGWYCLGPGGDKVDVYDTLLVDLNFSSN